MAIGLAFITFVISMLLVNANHSFQRLCYTWMVRCYLMHNITDECIYYVAPGPCGLGVSFTVNNKSFKGEKFCGLLGSSGMWGKVSRFFPSPPSYIHGFPTFYKRFNESFAFLRWTEFSLKLLLAYSEMDESALLQISRFPGWPCICSHRRKAKELQSKWVRDKTDR